MNKMKKRIKFFIFVTIFFLIVIVGITYRNIQILQPASINRPKNSQVVVMAGFPEKKSNGLMKEMNYAFKQANYLKDGDSLLKDENFKGAIEMYEVAFKEAKSQGSKGLAIYSIANAYEKKKDYEKAFKYVIIDKDQYVNDWAKEPVIERAKYLEYASKGEYDLAVEYAQKAAEASSKLPNRKGKPREDYIERLNDIKASKEYIENLKRK